MHARRTAQAMRAILLASAGTRHPVAWLPQSRNCSCLASWSWPIGPRAAGDASHRSGHPVRLALAVLNTYAGGYWEDREYNWFSGL